MLTKEHILESISNAEKGISLLSDDIYFITGFSTATMRRFFSNLCNTSFPINYLEIGLYCGGTFCSSFNKNCTSIGVENNSQNFERDALWVKDELADNIYNFRIRGKEVVVYYEDCFLMDKTKLPKIDIYFYDGFHSEESQEKALLHFFDVLSDRFIWIVDDFNWQFVADGTNKALKKLNDKIKIEQVSILKGNKSDNDPVWHNGLAVYLINKI